MLLNDRQLNTLAKQGLISPYCEQQVRLSDGGMHRLISYGQSSYGYDVRLSPAEFKIFRHKPGHIIDPKRFNSECLVNAELHEDGQDRYFILPGHSYGLGVSLERFVMPTNVLGICMAKSTYARCGIDHKVTPLEPGWAGHITMEYSNSSPADTRIYANEGVLQVIFLEGEPCSVDYSKRNGKYQNQGQMVTLAIA